MEHHRHQSSTIACCCFILLLGLLQHASCYATENRTNKLPEFQSELQRRSSSSAAAAYNPANKSSISMMHPKRRGKVFYPIGYGADPSGSRDSADPILRAINDAFQLQNGHRRQLLPGIHDLGGIVIDLQGGNFLISKPIRFPPGTGNIVVQSGSLRASDDFPANRHLIELWSLSPRVTDKASYYEGITFRDIIFDSSYRGGGIRVVDSVRIRIDHCFFLHFTTHGVLIIKGHETLISSCFLGQQPTVGEDQMEKHYSGTAIDIDSNDNVITDVVIFSAAVGIVLRSEANTVTGVHCYNKADVYGGVGILVKPEASLTRIGNCYMDFTGVVIEDPSQVRVTDGLFIGGANVVLRSIKGSISGLNIEGNMFRGYEGVGNSIVELDGNFTAVDQVVIERNNVKDMVLKSTAGRVTVAGHGSRWVADFSRVLIFPNRVSHFQYAFHIRGAAEGGGGAGNNVTHWVSGVRRNAVVVESSAKVNAVVSVVVDQYNAVDETSYLLSES
ncbi:unnamed protein product [Linum trigynum]|uniref:Pectin lyase-like superfamily protein n=1 Tax=Linum trigynum TaxID=586398 RepID=A0AAV2FVS7_9ROSI